MLNEKKLCKKLQIHIINGNSYLVTYLQDNTIRSRNLCIDIVQSANQTILHDNLLSNPTWNLTDLPCWR